MATPEEIAWAAGVFEGEGSMSVSVYDAGTHPAARNPHYHVVARVNMTDFDVVRRFHRIVGVGSVGPKTQDKRPHWQPQLLWQCGKRKDVEYVLRLFMPWLGERRRARANEVLAYADQNVGHWGWSRKTKDRSVTVSSYCRNTSHGRCRGHFGGGGQYATGVCTCKCHSRRLPARETVKHKE